MNQEKFFSDELKIEDWSEKYSSSVKTESKCENQ